MTERVGIPTIVLRPILILDDDDLGMIDEHVAELGAFVHIDDVAAAVVEALTTSVGGHVRAILCGPGDFDTTSARQALGWQATRHWPT